MDRPDQSPPHEFFPSPKRVRVLLAGQVIADTRGAMLLRREEAPPVYYFPRDDVIGNILVNGGREAEVSGVGIAKFYNLRVSDIEREAAAWAFIHTEPGAEFLRNYLAFDWDAMDGWFEEDLEVFVHPRDPRKRIDIALSSSHIEVKMNGVSVAQSDRPTFLFETGLPVRYYLPKLDVRQDLLEPSNALSYCPYKGEARYYSLRTGDHLEKNVAWFYRFPTLEASAIATQIAFYQERVAVYVDGVRV